MRVWKDSAGSTLVKLSPGHYDRPTNRHAESWPILQTFRTTQITRAAALAQISYSLLLAPFMAHAENPSLPVNSYCVWKLFSSTSLQPSVKLATSQRSS